MTARSLGSMAVALLGCACGRVDFGTVADDAASELVDGAACQFGPFGAPEPIIAINSTTSGELDPSYGPDGLTLYFMSNAGATIDILVSTRTATSMAWGVPSPAPGLATSSPDEGNPGVASSGDVMFFGVGAIYRSNFLGTVWGPPLVEIGTTGAYQNPMGPDLSSNDLEMYFSAVSVSLGEIVLLVSSRPDAASPFSTVTEIVTAHQAGRDDGLPAIAPSGLELFYHAFEGGRLSLLRSTRATLADSFPVGEVIPGIGGAGFDDSDPDISPDGSTLVFASTRSGVYDLYESKRECR